MKYLEYILVFALLHIFRILPHSLSLKAGSILGSICRLIFTYRRKLVLKNLLFSFPEKTLVEVLKIGREVWKNLGMTAAEFARIPYLNKENIHRFVNIKNIETLENISLQGKGSIISLAHIGNWEVVGITLSLLGFPVMALVKPMNNIFVERMISKIRKTSGGKIVYLKGGVSKILNWLKDGNFSIILIDQKILEKPIEVDFLGRKAMISPILSIISKRLNIPVVPICGRRNNRKIEIEVETPIIFTTNDHKKNTMRIIHIIENWIKKTPEQWFWVHNLWQDLNV